MRKPIIIACPTPIWGERVYKIILGHSGPNPLPPGSILWESTRYWMPGSLNAVNAQDEAIAALAAIEREGLYSLAELVAEAANE